MCCGGDTIERVRLTRCRHGVFHLYLGGQTLHLTLEELVLIGQSINKWVHNNPQVLEGMDDTAWHSIQNRIDLD